MIAPGGDDQSRTPCRGEQMGVIVRADGIGVVKQSRGIRRAEGEEIDHAQLGVAPSLGEHDALPDRGVVLRGVRRAGIEPDEDDGALPRRPATGQAVTVRRAR